MEVKKNELDKLYGSYGFEVSSANKDLGIYLYKKGRYFGVDIVPLINSKEINDLAEKQKEEYSENGYAASVKKFQTIIDAERELFKSFFEYNNSIVRIKRKYTDFVNKQTRNLLGFKYEYISTPFELDANINHSTDGKLTEKILKDLNSESPKLIIIEAAAGYGKTCTAYELLNTLAENKNYLKIPLFTELSRNRGANIFRYILLDEIDLEYPHLNSDLVIKEIKSGNIPLIIDGFDELLDKVNINNPDAGSNFEEVETMLDTIGNLLENRSKIILTTRKTAIFSGYEFDSWIEKWGNKFETLRYSIRDPKIKDWIGESKYRQIQEKNVPIQHVANPVILTFLKNSKQEEFNSLIEKPGLLVKEYFNKMLEREKERQNLIITIDKQYELFKNVVKLMLEFDITSESKEFFKEIIKDQNTKLLEYTRTLYSGINKPTLENLVDSLATHALLDRKGRDENQIGFINDFVLGTFIGEILIEAPIEKIQESYSAYMMELSVTAYKVQSARNRNLLWDKISLVSHKFQSFLLFQFDLTLKEELTRDYENVSISDLNIFDIEFFLHKIGASLFINCTFKNCGFDINQLEGVSFVNCTFINCLTKESNFLDHSDKTTVIKCKQVECSVLEFPEINYEQNTEQFTSSEKQLLAMLLEFSKERSVSFTRFLHFLSKNDKEIIKSISPLEKRGVIILNDNQIYYNINKLPEIKKALNV